MGIAEIKDLIEVIFLSVFLVVVIALVGFVIPFAAKELKDLKKIRKKLKDE